MKHLFTLVFILCTWMPLLTNAQDVHFTQYERAPLLLNPALTGAFHGTARVGALYRGQAITASPHAYSTPAVYVDAPIIKGFRDRDWVGVGAMLYRDAAGTGSLVNTGFYISGSYHFALDKNGNNYLTLGIQNGSYNRTFKNKDRLRFEDEIRDNGISTSPDAMMLPNEDNPQGENEWGGGLLFTSKLSEEHYFRAGFRVNHLVDKNYSLTSGGGRYILPILWNAYASYDFRYSDRVTFTPSAYYQQQGEASQAVFQARGAYTVNKEKEIDLTGGLGYRFGDAAQLLLGMRWKQIDVGVAFDITLSPLANATDYFGGFELAASYIFKVYKEPEIEPVIICPRF